jgi:hypothetical protein
MEIVRAALMCIEGFQQILEQMMQAAGPQGPLPATDAVIEGLPRIKLDADAIGELLRVSHILGLIIRKERLQRLSGLQG